MEPEEKLGIIIAVVVLFGGGIWRWWTTRRERKQANQQLYAQPELQAGAADGSMARVGGTVVATGQKLVAPLSRRECVMYWTRIITQDNENKDTIQFAPFALDRGPEGMVHVDAQFARMDLPTIPVPQDGPLLEQFAMSMGLNISQAARSQYYEIVVEPGQHITIAGTVMTDGGAPQGYRSQGVQYKIAGNQQHPIVIGR
jgi:hypothetical protein